MLEPQLVSLIAGQSLGSNMALEQLALMGDGPHYWDIIKSFQGLWDTAGAQAGLKLRVEEPLYSIDIITANIGPRLGRAQYDSSSF